MTRPDPKVFDFAEHEKRIDRLIASKFKSSFMSNSKWRKLFSVLNSIAGDLQVTWKFVDHEIEGHRNSLPSIQSLKDSYIDGDFWFGPRYYKEIEWIEFPSVFKPLGKEDIPFTHHPQDIGAVISTLQGKMILEIEETEFGVRIYGFK